MLSVIKVDENCILKRVGWGVMMDKWDLVVLVGLVR